MDTQINLNNTILTSHSNDDVPVNIGSTLRSDPPREVQNEPKADKTIGVTKSRDFYRGRSFRYVGLWEEGVHYISDDYLTDFVSKDGVMLVCTKSHMSSAENMPTDWVKRGDTVIGVDSEYWDVVLVGGLKGRTYKPRYDMDSDSIIWKLIDPSEAEEEFASYLGIRNLVEFLMGDLDTDINGLKGRLSNLDGDLSSLSIITSHLDGSVRGLGRDVNDLSNSVDAMGGSLSARMDNFESDLVRYTQNEEGFRWEVQNLEGDLGQMWLTAEQFGVRLTNAEGDMAQFLIMADEISTRVENAEGDISQMHQRADEIWTQVENAKGDISVISQKADQITTKVENALGDVSTISQRADEIQTQVENAQGDISNITQRADEIASFVQNSLGDVSRISQQADQIQTQVENALGDVSSISQRADVIETTVSNMQGDISDVSQHADEIEASVRNAEGDISVVSQRADVISSEVSNIKGDVSTVTQRADEIDTRVENIKGDISQVQQRADEISSSVENVSGDVSTISQRADAISLDVQNVLGDVSSISQRADIIETEVRNTKGDVSTVSQKADEIEQSVRDVEGNVSAVSQRADSIASEVSNAKGDISTLTQRADEITSTVESVEGDMSTIWQRSDEINQRVENAEGDITVISQKADEVTSQVQNAVSDVSNISQRADVIETSVSNIQGNVSNISQRATDIEVSVRNAEGDISSLSQKADSLDTEVQNIHGDISIVSQRANEIASTVENMQGDVSQVSQKADEVVSTVENIEGDVSVISQRADVIEQTVADAVGDVSEVSQRADQIETRVIGAEGDISRVSQKADEIESTVQNAQGDIAQIIQRADLIEETIRSNKEDADGSFLELESKIRQTADEISSEVDATKTELDNKITATNSRITQQAGLIEQKVSQTEYDTKIGQIEQDTSRIEQRADNISQSVSRVSGEISSVDQTLAQYITSNDAVVAMILDQMDGAIDTWFYEGIPTLNNLPASDWTTTDLKDLHIGDIYYDKQGGGTYRFLKDNGVYRWVEIQDDALADALALAQDAYDVATDHKRRIFIVQPTPPYDEGDLWVQGHIDSGNDAGNGMILRCINSRTTGVFNASDWDVAFDMVTAKIAKSSFDIFADAIQGRVYQQDPNGIITSNTYSNVKQTVDTINLHIENTKSALRATGIDITGVQFDEHGQPLSGGSVVITADNFKIQANNSAVQDAISIVLEDNHPKISVSSLEINGIFSTSQGSTWLGIRNNLNTTAQGYASDALSSAKSYTDSEIGVAKSYADTVSGTAYTNAQTYLNNIIYGSGGSAQEPTNNSILGYINALDNDVDDLFTAIGSIDAQSLGLSYITDALLNGTTVSAGGLILTSLIQLGTTSPWNVWAGMSGQYVSQEDTDPTSQTAVGKGHGIAAWYGGTMADRFYNKHNTAQSRTAVSLFRMDGSGYLAKRNIEWEADGSGNVAQGNISWDANGQLTVRGGILTTELKAGYQIYGFPWTIMSGISGDYDCVMAGHTGDPPMGHGIAAWFGGDKVDLESLSDYWNASQIAQWNAMTSEQKAASTLVAKSLFRFDGSGYLASGQIAWGKSGSLHFGKDIVFDGDDESTDTDTIVREILRLSSYFEDEEIELDGQSRHILRIKTDSQNQGNSGFIGVAWDGLLLTTGDHIVGDTQTIQGLPQEQVRHVILSQDEWENMEHPDPGIIYMIYE